MITPHQIIADLQSREHVPGEHDCWSVVEVWYRELYGIDVMDRDGRGPGIESVQASIDDGLVWWQAVSLPQDGDLALMRSRQGRRICEAGHVGIYWRDLIVHSEHASGLVVQPLDRRIERRITGWLRYVGRLGP